MLDHDAVASSFLSGVASAVQKGVGTDMNELPKCSRANVKLFGFSKQLIKSEADGGIEIIQIEMKNIIAPIDDAGVRNSAFYFRLS